MRRYLFALLFSVIGTASIAYADDSESYGQHVLFDKGTLPSTDLLPSSEIIVDMEYVPVTPLTGVLRIVREDTLIAPVGHARPYCPHVFGMCS